MAVTFLISGFNTVRVSRDKKIIEHCALNNIGHHCENNSVLEWKFGLYKFFRRSWLYCDINTRNTLIGVLSYFISYFNDYQFFFLLFHNNNLTIVKIKEILLYFIACPFFHF